MDLQCTRPRSARSRLAASLAVLAAGSLVLSGCADEGQEARDALSSAEERLSRTEERLRELEDEVDRKADLGDLQEGVDEAVSGAASQARDAAGQLREDAEGAVQDAVDSLPGFPDAQDVEEVTEDGRVVIEMAEEALNEDSADLERRLREAADKAREAAPDLKDVEFRVGDQTFTF